MPQIATVSLVGGFREDGAIGAPEEHVPDSTEAQNLKGVTLLWTSYSLRSRALPSRPGSYYMKAQVAK
jgi:hypothetical protein